MLRCTAPRIIVYPICRLGTKIQMKGKKKMSRYDYSDYESDFEVYGSLGSHSVQAQPYATASFRKAEPLVPRNPRQERYIHLLESPNPPIVFAIGPAGVAKTYICNAIGIQKLLSGQVEKLVITRPAVSVDEQHGFLPGTLEDKMDPWMRPIYDVFHKFISPQQCTEMIKKQKIEICPLAYMRGRTFDDAWICADEMQNSTSSQMMMLLTRIGMNSKLVITGDPEQHDRGFAVNGLTDFTRRLGKCIDEQTHSDIQVVKFGAEDIERHRIIGKILNLYNADTRPPLPLQPSPPVIE
jgi:phosphate starvation-inducible protein PhoH and related proteins